MLDEWFATNKTREATNAVLTNLKEINRTDAAQIIEKALKAVGWFKVFLVFVITIIDRVFFHETEMYS